MEDEDAILWQRAFAVQELMDPSIDQMFGPKAQSMAGAPPEDVMERLRATLFCSSVTIVSDAFDGKINTVLRARAGEGGHEGSEDLMSVVDDETGSS